VTNAEARCNKSLRPRKPEGSLGRTAQDVHLDSHTAPELWELLNYDDPAMYTDYDWDKYSDKVQQALILVAHLHASTVNQLRLLTVNVRGLKNKRKRKSVFSFLQKGNYDIVGLQECHVSTKEEAES